MAVVLTYAGTVPVVKMGRIAGQFGKPRSGDTEARTAWNSRPTGATRSTASTSPPPNGRPTRAACCELSLLGRHPEPVRAFTAAATPTCARYTPGTTTSWPTSPAGQRYERLAAEIDRALAFMRACGADPEELRAVEFYASHEAPAARLRAGPDPDRRAHGQAYDLSAHLLWIGERTRTRRRPRRVRAADPQPDRVKLGPAPPPDDVLA